MDDLVAGTTARSYEPWNPPAEILDLGDGLIVELVKMFRADTARSLSRIGDLLSKADFDGVKAAAHTIKGGARQMGANAVASICEEVETAAREASASKLEERLARLRAAFSNVCVEMAAFIGQRRDLGPLVHRPGERRLNRQ
ncbi:MAG: Hpt domain-containing protein [Candidatus Solibacter sp.]|jgi:HPt (histidine-containing phosphotransfer) domain-containing protein